MILRWGLKQISHATNFSNWWNYFQNWQIMYFSVFLYRGNYNILLLFCLIRATRAKYVERNEGFYNIFLKFFEWFYLYTFCYEFFKSVALLSLHPLCNRYILPLVLIAAMNEIYDDIWWMYLCRSCLWNLTLCKEIHSWITS